ncbi:MAG TPA: adenosylcobalamin-dependent ribonucleoside-diphosphate reductase [Candidatus Nanoarchaeia archaeon]|nr:adenosylcobalamin-dependent ribonucleoside-diphosphate reductase [Candidatus Nanoarchaeia archaeon]
MPKLNLSKNALTILEHRYLKKNAKGGLIEKPENMFRRVAKNISLADAKYSHSKQIKKIQKKYKKEFYEIVETKEFKKLAGNDRELKKTEEEFYSLMSSLDFLPNSPTLLNAGRKLQQLAACFVLPIEDDIDSIFKILHDTARIHKTGAGTGFNFSGLRQKGDLIESAGYTSGAVSFMKIYDAATEQIKLGGTLRGANMGILNFDHPDIEEFITAKSDPNALTNFNVSVAITDKFIEAVKKNKEYNLISPRTKKPVKKESAKRIFEMISQQAWNNGDPGVIFIDRINKFNPTPELGMIESTDSCGEQPLLPYESCNLGSINLSNMVQNKKINYEKLRKTIRAAVHVLDNVIDMCDYPLKENRKIVEKNRKIGLGIMGFADMLIKLGFAYDSDEGLEKAEEVMRFISEESNNASMELAKTRGTFPSWKSSIYNSKKNTLKNQRFLGHQKRNAFFSELKLRNATRTTIAPTGTISIIANASSGIEPLFALSYARRTSEGKDLIYFHEELKKVLIEKNLYSDEIIEKIHREGSLKNIEEIPEAIKEIFVVGSDIGPEWHVRMQAAFQKYVDNGISKTVTLPKDASLEDVERIFLLAHELGCKGISIYRSGSREGQVIYLRSKRDEQITLKDFVRG